MRVHPTFFDLATPLHAESHCRRCIGSPSDARDTEESDDVTNTVVIAVCSVVAYLGLIIGLTVYCSLRLVRRLNRRKRHTSQPPADGQ